jgi:hypothetical protein
MHRGRAITSTNDDDCDYSQAGRWTRTLAAERRMIFGSGSATVHQLDHPTMTSMSPLLLRDTTQLIKGCDYTVARDWRLASVNWKGESSAHYRCLNASLKTVRMKKGGTSWIEP